MRYRYLSITVFIFLCGSTLTSARASPEGDPLTAYQTSVASQAPALAESCRKHPWYCGVTQEDQAQALSLYAEGNQLFDDSLFTAAVAKYEQAIERWDHPGIHYNRMMALVALDRPIEAYQSSIGALRHGPGALEPEEHRRAEDYQKLLRGRIAELTVACDEPGALVSLDGKNILKGPGETRVFVLPGQHELVARKPGYLATHHALLLVAARPASVHLRMLPDSEALITSRPWSAWQPWAVVGAGAGLGLVGGLLEWRADASNRAFQKLFYESCPAPEGCEAVEYTDAMESHQRRYRWHRRLGHGALATGGAAMIGGLVLVYLNRPHEIENPRQRHLVRVTATPIVTPGMGGLSFNVSF
ncbi:MAG TPA: hypothetical protein VNM90_09235 [Haliangium sp.]|nr:hypothetical protein [Haliangium sp.]